MGGTIEHFSGALTAIPPDVYLDTSFILRCYYAHFTPSGIRSEEKKKNVDCNTFLGRLSGSRTHTSLFATEEAFHRLYFTAHIKRVAGRKGMSNNWKQFRKVYPTDFQNARHLGILEMRRFLSFLSGTTIHLIGATSFSQKERYLSLVQRYAQLFIEKYEISEAMDAFHVAVMRANRIDWLVTAEENLGSGFDEFSVLTL